MRVCPGAPVSKPYLLPFCFVWEVVDIPALIIRHLSNTSKIMLTAWVLMKPPQRVPHKPTMGNVIALNSFADYSLPCCAQGMKGCFLSLVRACDPLRELIYVFRAMSRYSFEAMGWLWKSSSSFVHSVCFGSIFKGPLAMECVVILGSSHMKTTAVISLSIDTVHMFTI